MVGFVECGRADAPEVTFMSVSPVLVRGVRIPLGG
jgi:hypothetical protein